MVRILSIAMVLLVGIYSASGKDTIFQLGDTSAPLIFRQQKAQGLVKSWGFASGDVPYILPINEEADLIKVQQALNHLLEEADDTMTSVALPVGAEQYLVWTIARAQILNSLDVSDEALQRFYRLNSQRYPCKPTARVSELLLPKTYVDGLGTTAIVAEVSERLTTEPFARVSYDITNRFGDPNTGLIGEVDPQRVGEERFNLYVNASDSGGTGGPYEVDGGYLFVQVHELFEGGDNCFHFHRSRVIVDYGREWLKRIYADTLTTAARQLRPEVREFTTGTSASATAYTIGKHSVTFEESRQMLPFLMGNQKDPRFWQSVQRQALDIDLVYRSSTGKAIRESAEFKNLYKVLLLIRNAKQELSVAVKDRSTTDRLRHWYQQNSNRFTTIDRLSYEIYRCEKNSGYAAGKQKCAALLEQLQNGDIKSSDAALLLKDDVTSVTWESRSREIQVACQELEPGEWSGVFSENGQPQVLFLKAIDRRIPQFQEVQEQVRQQFKQKLREDYWREVLEDRIGRVEK